MDLDRFPRVALAHLPTPLEPLERLSAHLHGPRQGLAGMSHRLVPGLSA